MADSDRVAIAAHLHVALRRKAGRVTDMDWMAVNDEYAWAIVRLTREKAEEFGDASLAEMAIKLQACLEVQRPRTPEPVPLVERVKQQWRDPVSRFSSADEDESARYVGGLR